MQLTDSELQAFEDGIASAEKTDDGKLEATVSSLPSQSDLLCAKCAIALQKNGERSVCPKCGLIGQEVLVTSDEPTSSALRIFGPNAGELRKVLSPQSTENVFQEYMICNQNCPTPFPEATIRAATTLFESIRSIYVKRGEIRKQVMAACLYYECRRAKQSRPKSEFATLLGISSMSDGDALLQRLHKEHVITLPPNADPSEDYLNGMFVRLNLPFKYLPNTVELIHRANKFAIGQDSNAKARCAGAIWLVAEAFGLNIAGLEKEIRFPTLKKFTDNIMRYKSRFKDILTKTYVPPNVPATAPVSVAAVQ